VANAGGLGFAAAITCPATRGDAGTVAAHVAVLGRDAPDVLPVYRALVERDARLAVERGSLSPEAAERLRTALAGDP
jgi:predicted short-subunit dehydrogenase-like oxidoreductase (DUF2520 family)